MTPSTTVAAGASAPRIASSVGCTGVVIAAGSTDTSGTVNCRYQGRTLGIIRFPSPEQQAAYLKRQGKGAWYAAGDGWVVGLGDGTTAGSKEIAQRIQAAVGGQLTEGGS